MRTEAPRLEAAGKQIPETLDILQEIKRRKLENDIPATGIPEVDSILKESYGMLVYQEQVFKMCFAPTPLNTIRWPSSFLTRG